MSYQEKDGQAALSRPWAGPPACLLILAGQYESWYAPVSIILSVPLALVGPVSVLNGLGIDNNLYVQIGLIL
jgi:hydrophobic/amphiphilic exporter-1 (mainly G- bacteria), HAE1 family